MFLKAINITFFLFFSLGALLLVKPLYFYSKGMLIDHLLIGYWNDYKCKGIIEDRWLSIKPIGKLNIDSISLEHIILNGCGQQELSYGLGKVNESTLLHEKNSNIIIAGHRDSFFKKLQYIANNDKVVLEHIEGKSIYKVENILIVDQFESEYIVKNQQEKLQLITCFPFEFTGPAPKRFIVQCNLVDS
tara:strand:- start:905 stop:1471 length:567 start_codon:yes stop_codon:yes gene_type:complete